MSELTGRRFHRLFGADGRSVVVAMDHGTTDGAVAGFETPQSVLEQVIAGGVDAILTSVGIARHFSKQLKDVGLLIRCDGATSPLLEHSRELIIGVDDVLSTGADAAAAMYIPGTVYGHNSTIYFPRVNALKRLSARATCRYWYWVVRKRTATASSWLPFVMLWTRVRLVLSLAVTSGNPPLPPP